MIIIPLLVLVLIDFGQCARILGVFPAQGYSQFILGEKLMVEIALKGHDVTVISPYSPKTPIANYKTVSTQGLLNKFKDADLFKRESMNAFNAIMATHTLGLTIVNYTLSHPEVQNLIESKEKFDLVIVEQFFCEALNAFSSHFNAPLVIFSSIGLSEWNNGLMGLPNLPSVMPISRLKLTTKMDLYERAENSIAFVFDLLYKSFVVFPKHQKMINKYFPVSVNLHDVMYNASLVLLNSHFSITEPSALVNGMVEIGGFHISVNKSRISGKLQDFLDNAKDGVIYFSMGTNLKFKNVHQDTVQALVNVFSKLKQKIVWKCDKHFENLPENIFVSEWLPQQEILNHNNVKLFITHGGLLSTTEAVHFGVPIIGIPIFGDQKMNIAKVQKHGYGIELPYTALNEAELLKTITEILNNPKYAKNVKDRSSLYHDQPIKPLDLALYWVEFVLRQKDNIYLLRYAGMNLKWYQYYLLDVLCIILIPFIFVFFIILLFKLTLSKNVIKVKTN